jgi:hypothetical protein
MKKITVIASMACSLILTQMLNAQAIVGSTSHMMVADGKLIIGGLFEKSDRRVVNNVTTYDGTKFTGLAKGVDGPCKGLASDGKNIYVAGDFTVVNKGTDGAGELKSPRIAKWDGLKWVSLGEQTVDRQVFCAATKDGKLYIGGNFTKIGGTIDTKGIGVYDGKKWSALGNAQFDRAVTVMTFFGKDLYCGGIFTLNGDEPMERFAKWDGTKWSEAVPRGLRGINAMVSTDKNLVLGGEFGVKLFDGTKLIDIPGAPEGNVSGVCVDGDKIYICGAIKTLKIGKKEVPTGGIAMWDGTKWNAFPEIPYSFFKCMAVYNGVLYVGGEVTDGIAKFENGAWVKVIQ